MGNYGRFFEQGKVLTDAEARGLMDAMRDGDYRDRLVESLRMSALVEVDNPMRRELRPRRGSDES